MASAASPLAAARANAEAAPPDAPAPDAHTRAGIAPDGLPPRLPDALRIVWQDLRGALHSRLRLLTLELRLAGITLAQMLLYAVSAALLGVTAWLALVAGIVWGLIDAGLHWALALGAGIVLNLVVAALLAGAMMKLLSRLDLPGTLRAIKPQAAPPQAPSAGGAA